MNPLRIALALAATLGLVACDDGDPSTGADGAVPAPSGDLDGHWVTVEAPIAEFPARATYHAHIEFDGALFLLYDDGGDGRLLRYDGGPFTRVLDGDAAFFGSDLVVYGGDLYATYLQRLGPGQTRLGLARYTDAGMEVVRADVMTLGPSDVPRAFVQGGALWFVAADRSMGARTGALHMARYDGEQVQVLDPVPPPDPAYDSTVHVSTEGDAAWFAFGASGNPNGDFTDPFAVFAFDGEGFAPRFVARSAPFLVWGGPALHRGQLYVSEQQLDGHEIARYGEDGSRVVIATADEGYVFGPVRVTNLGPTWVRYISGSVSNRYSRNQYYDVDAGRVVDLPYRWPEGRSQEGGTDAESVLFGAARGGTRAIVAFTFAGQHHLIANVIAGSGQAGDPYALYLMRFESP